MEEKLLFFLIFCAIQTGHAKRVGKDKKWEKKSSFTETNSSSSHGFILRFICGNFQLFAFLEIFLALQDPRFVDAFIKSVPVRWCQWRSRSGKTNKWKSSTTNNVIRRTILKHNIWFIQYFESIDEKSLPKKIKVKPWSWSTHTFVLLFVRPT